MKIPLHLKYWDVSPAAREARMMLVTSMAHLNPKGFRQPSERTVGLSYVEKRVLEAGLADVPAAYRSKRGNKKREQRALHVERLQEKQKEASHG